MNPLRWATSPSPPFEPTRFAMTPPMGPVVLVVDHDMQERPLPQTSLRIPRLTMPSLPAGEAGAVKEVARLLVAAENPQINAGRAARTPNGIKLLVELAETLQAPVNGGGDRVNFPSRHPLAGNSLGVARCDSRSGGPGRSQVRRQP